MSRVNDGHVPQNIGFHTLLRIPLANSILCLHSLYLPDIYPRTHADYLSAFRFPLNSGIIPIITNNNRLFALLTRSTSEDVKRLK